MTTDSEQLSSKRMKLPEMQRYKSQENLSEHPFYTRDSCNLPLTNYSFSSCDDSSTSDRKHDDQNYFGSRDRLPSQSPSPPNGKTSKPDSGSPKSVNHVTDSVQQSPDCKKVDVIAEPEPIDPFRKFMIKKREAEAEAKKKKTTENWTVCLDDFTHDEAHAETLFYSKQQKLTVSDSALTIWRKDILESPPTVSSPSNLSVIQSNTEYANYLKELEKLNSNVSFIDTHCHLDFLFKQTCFRKNSHSAYQRLHKSSYPSCYEGCVAIFCDPKTFKEDTWKEILAEDKVWAAFGCHPHNADSYSDEIENDMKIALKHEKVVALGEIGLDYSSRNSSNRQKQKKVFRRQLELAKELNLPVVIHSRDAAKDTLEIMKEILPSDFKIHRHCFTRNWTEAQLWLNEFTNLYLGLTNLVTFDDVIELHEVAKKIPLEKLLLETDAPYFVPRLESKGNRRSHPGMAIHVAIQVASLRSEPLETILKSTRDNTKKMYGI